MTNKEIAREAFPVGFYDDLHKDFSINFQMNRFYNWTNDESMLDEMRAVSPGITNYAEYIDALTSLSEKALAAGHKLKAANYLRGAEFFLKAADSRKAAYRRKFLQLVHEHFNIQDSTHYEVPYEAGCLSAYRFTPEAPKGTFVMFGGFDSYIDELFNFAMVIKKAGYDVICFDGPGQGSTLEDYKLPMTYKWEEPVKAVLDFFQVDDVTLFGMSLGGYLVLRAAAFESRVKRVIVDGILLDFYEEVFRQLPAADKARLDQLLLDKDEATVNNLLTEAARNSMIFEWMLSQGMHVMGCTTPYAFAQKVRLFTTKEIAGQVQQDVILLAGQKDHYIPISHFFEQGSLLTNVQSLTMRMFTQQESGQNHCQIGNIGLGLRVMLDWMEQCSDK